MLSCTIIELEMFAWYIGTVHSPFLHLLTPAIHLGNEGMLSQYKYIKNVQEIYYGLPLFDRRKTILSHRTIYERKKG